MPTRLPLCRERCATACAGEILANPWIGIVPQTGNGPNSKLSIDQYGYPIGRRAQCIDIVCHHEYRQMQTLLQTAHQHVELRGRDWIEPSSRFIQKQDIRI